MLHELNAYLFRAGAASEDGQEALVQVCDFAGFEISVYDYRIRDDWNWFKGNGHFPPGGNAFERLKRLKFEAGPGSWISIKVHLFPDRDPYAEFIYDREISFDGPLERPASAGSIYRELVAFPRTAENIPAWMREKIEGAGEEVPVFDPATNEIVIGENRYPFTEPGP